MNIMHIEASLVVPGDIILRGLASKPDIVHGSEVERVDEYDETWYVYQTDGFCLGYNYDEIVTVIR